MEGNYAVNVGHFAERHFIKTFEKKYKSHWDATLTAIIAGLERIDMLLLTDRAETICDIEGIKIIKTKFKVAVSKESAKTSGNRCIVAWHQDKQFVTILLVYTKTDVRGNRETDWWKAMIRDNYPEYKKLL